MNKKVFYDKKNTKYLIILLLFMVVFIYIGIYQITENVIEQIEDTSYDYLLSTTEIVESKVDSSLEKDVKKLDYLAEAIVFDQRTLKYALKEFSRNNELYSTFYLDNDGKGINQDAISVDVKDIKVEETALSKGKSSVSPVYLNNAGDFLFMVQTPVIRNDVQKGALYCEIMVQHYYTNELFAFQEGKGRTFIVNSANGSWLLKSPASDMIKLNDDGLYATMEENGNSKTAIEQLKDSVSKQKTGVFEIQGSNAKLILCTTPVHEVKDWQMVTIMHADLFANQIAHIKRNAVFIALLSIVLIFVVIGVVFITLRHHRKRYSEKLEQQYQIEKDAVEAMNREIIMRNCDFCVRVDLDEAKCDVMIYHDTNAKANLFHDDYPIALKAYSKEIYMDDVDEFMKAYSLNSLKKVYQAHVHQETINYRIMSEETLWYECYSTCYYLHEHRYVYLFHRNISQEMNKHLQLIQEKYH